jgi:alpha-1,3-glucosyltransferase
LLQDYNWLVSPSLTPNRILHLVKLGVATIATFALMFAPWISTDPQHVLWVVHRIFPLARGLFEDKVANFWCASNVAIKWRTWFSVTGLARVSQRRRLLAA